MRRRDHTFCRTKWDRDLSIHHSFMQSFMHAARNILRIFLYLCIHWRPPEVLSWDLPLPTAAHVGLPRLRINVSSTAGSNALSVFATQARRRGQAEEAPQVRELMEHMLYMLATHSGGPKPSASWYCRGWSHSR